MANGYITIEVVTVFTTKVDELQYHIFRSADARLMLLLSSNNNPHSVSIKAGSLLPIAGFDTVISKENLQP